MPHTTTRERKIKFINDFGHGALTRAVTEAFTKHGPDWLTDDQIDNLVAQEITRWRFQQRFNRRYRNLTRQKGVDVA